MSVVVDRVLPVLSLSVMVAPAMAVPLAAVPVMEVGVGTVMVALADFPPLLALITLVPAFSAVTTPVVPTFAIVGLLALQVNFTPVMAWPVESLATAFRVSLLGILRVLLGTVR